MRITWPIVKLYIKLKAISLLTAIGWLEPDEVFYVGSAEILPPPLSSDEEVFLLNRLQKGDKSVKVSLLNGIYDSLSTSHESLKTLG